jgi:hypothetical protein
MSSTDHPETIEPVWTEGVCGDGAVFLHDGVPVTISGVLAALNAESDLSAAREEIAELRKALGPFVVALPEYYSHRPDSAQALAVTFRVGDFRAAHKALRSSRTKGDPS